MSNSGKVTISVEVDYIYAGLVATIAAALSQSDDGSLDAALASSLPEEIIDLIGFADDLLDHRNWTRFLAQLKAEVSRMEKGSKDLGPLTPPPPP